MGADREADDIRGCEEISDIVDKYVIGYAVENGGFRSE